jgi:hypothetical protein
MTTEARAIVSGPIRRSLDRLDRLAVEMQRELSELRTRVDEHETRIDELEVP